MRGFRNGFDVLRNPNIAEKIVSLFLTEGAKPRYYDRFSEGFIGKMQECKRTDGDSPIFKVTKKTTDCIKGL